jgi:hypothetical protein
MPAVTGQDAADALRARLDRFLASGDPAEICSAETTNAADAVLATLNWQALERADQNAAAWESVLLVVCVDWARSGQL